MQQLIDVICAEMSSERETNMQHSCINGLAGNITHRTWMTVSAMVAPQR